MSKETVTMSHQPEPAILGRKLKFNRQTVREFNRGRQADVPIFETCSSDVSNSCCGPSCFTACCPP